MLPDYDRSSTFVGINQLLKLAGFNQNGRNRIIHLSGDEINAITDLCPSDSELWPSYVNELQTLLGKIDVSRKMDSCMGRPYVTSELIKTICALARLRFIYKSGICSVPALRIRDLILHDDWYHETDQFLEFWPALNQQDRELLDIQSAIQFMELHRNELLMPPRLRTRVNFDEFDLHMIESGDLHWMDDGGKSYLSYIRDIPLVSHYDELPRFESVLDWFISTRPVLDKNQIKRGWEYLEKLSEEWHRHQNWLELYGESILQYPSWSCAIADRQEEWLSVLPPGFIYKLVPLASPAQLMEESISMHHCVVTYIDDCVSGNARIFSVRDSNSDQRIATVELVNHSGLWVLAQLKGKHNCQLNKVEGPLTVLLTTLIRWYNQNLIM